MRHFTWFLAGFEGKSQKAASNFLIGRHFYREVTLREKERDAEKSARALVVVLASLKEEGKRRGFEKERDDDENIFAFIYSYKREREKEREIYTTHDEQQQTKITSPEASAF